MCAEIVMGDQIIENVGQLRRCMPHGIMIHPQYLSMYSRYTESHSSNFNLSCLCSIDVEATLRVNQMEYQYDLCRVRYTVT